MYAASIIKEHERVHRYSITEDGLPTSYGDVLALWQESLAFQSFFVSLLVDSPFAAFRWETPPISSTTTSRAFEFVLIDSPELSRRSDDKAFEDHFTADDAHEGIVSFQNLGKDATLVVPSPRAAVGEYAHLASFLRSVPAAQRHALWRTVGSCAQQALTKRPLWISTAGAGVSWLHVRLDSWPKYYQYDAYKKIQL